MSPFILFIYVFSIEFTQSHVVWFWYFRQEFIFFFKKKIIQKKYIIINVDLRRLGQTSLKHVLL